LSKVAKKAKGKGKDLSKEMMTKARRKRLAHATTAE
jgi:hypothetical protein